MSYDHSWAFRAHWCALKRYEGSIRSCSTAKINEAFSSYKALERMAERWIKSNRSNRVLDDCEASSLAYALAGGIHD